MKKRITLTFEGQRLVKEAIDAGKKIQAIKAVRTHGKMYPADESRDNPHRPGLREAKHAIDVKYFGADPRDAAATIGPTFTVKKMVVEVGGEGNVEIDIDELQLRFLQELKSLGLDQVQHLLELTEFIRDWQR